MDKIIELEKGRLTAIDKDIEKLKEKESAIKETKKQLVLVGENAKKLYGLYSVFRDFKVQSSENQSVEAVIKNPNLRNKDVKIKVKQLATNHTLSSQNIKKNQSLPPSRIVFVFEGEKHPFYFKGGTLEELIVTFDQDVEIRKRLNMHFVHQNEKEDILILSSTKTGKENSIQIAQDTGGLFTNSLGFFKAKPPIIQPLSTSAEILQQLSETESQDVWNGKHLNFSPNQKRTITFTEKIFKLSKVKSIFFPIAWQSLIQQPEKQNVPTAPQNSPKKEKQDEKKQKTAEKETIRVGNLRYRVQLDENNWSEWLEKEITNKNISANGNIVIQGNVFSGLENIEEETNIHFDSLTLVNERTEQLQTVGIPKIILHRDIGDRYVDQKALNQAKNAIFEYEGIPIERQSNIVDDLVDGASFTLKKTNETPVNLKPQYDEENILTQFIAFVQAYNKFVEYLNILISRDKESLELGSKKLEERWEKRIGFFNSDYDFHRIKEFLRSLTSRLYPSDKDSLKILAEIGIKRAYKIKNPYDIDSDKLDIDLEKFRNSLKVRGSGVQRIFAYDSDKDGIIDNGFAYLLNEQITHYLSLRSVFELKKKSLGEDIAKTEKHKEREKEVIDEKTSKLMSDFAEVKRVMDKQKDTSKWLEGMQKK